MALPNAGRVLRAEPQLSSDVAALTRALVAQYAEFPEVEAIYRRVVGEEVTFWVFANKETYDEAFMNRLIEVELRLANTFRSIDQDINYFTTVSADDRNAVVGGNALRVFSVN